MTAPATFQPAVGSLPNSVMPHNDPACSVEVLPGSDSNCSVFPGMAGAKCTAHCDSGSQCSVLGTTVANGPITDCSVMGLAGGRCSVLQPPAVPAVSIAICSATDGQLQSNSCSVFAAGAPRPACSAQNPGGADICSAINSGGNAQPHCSVISGLTGPRQFCSAGFPGGQKQCSAAQAASCSVHVLANGLCTALKNAPANSCSVLLPGGHCSVILGSSGNPCRNP